jgi:group I intron endonuclease
MDVIYKISSPKGKVYIGRTDDFNRRMIEHKYCAYTKKAKNSLYKAIRKYGWDNMQKEILCEIEPSQSQKLEEEFILAYNSVKKGYNDTYIGSGGDMWVGKRDTKQYMEFVEKQRQDRIGEKNGMFGKTHKPDTLGKLKEKAKGRFTLDWYKERHGDIEGERLYEERRVWLKSRNLKKDENGRFLKSSK